MGELKAIEIEAKFLSDTIIIAISTLDKGERMAPDLVTVAAYVTSHVMALGLRDLPQFAFRGSVAFGEFLMEENFIVGPAVDDAAEHMNLAEGAFVWMTPTARAAVGRFPAAALGFVTNYSVPLKGWQLTIHSRLSLTRTVGVRPRGYRVTSFGLLPPGARRHSSPSWLRGRSR